MEKTPVLRLSGKRVKAKKLKVGAYRQIMLLLEDVEALDPEELKEDMVAAIQIAFDLSETEVDQMEAADVIPTFRQLAGWAHGIFTAKLQTLPNGERPAASPGD